MLGYTLYNGKRKESVWGGKKRQKRRETMRVGMFPIGATRLVDMILPS